MRLCLLFLTTLLVLGCNKPNPNPELLDPIYLDLDTQSKNSQRDVEATKKQLEGFKKELDKVTPQTGEIKYAQKRYFETEQKIAHLQQQVKYYELRAESRKKHAKQAYLKAFKEGKPWPNPEEGENYKKQRDLASIPLNWDLKERLKTYNKENGIASPGKGATETKKPEAAASGE